MIRQNKIIPIAFTASIGAMVCLVGMIGLIVAVQGWPPEISFEPNFDYSESAAAAYTELYGSAPTLTLIYFAVDSLFAVGYVLTLIGLVHLRVEKGAWDNIAGYGGAVAVGLFDWADNAILVWITLQASSSTETAQATFLNQALLIAWLHHLKWIMAAGVILLLAFSWPRKTIGGILMALFMLSFSAVVATAFVFTQLAEIRVMYFLVGLILFAIHLRRASRGQQEEPVANG